ncbi:DUF5132 domain-containing protein [Kitasatospora sp. NPDC057940]|uniref:DUF5132 domain-containing protein n=1 Tax=unclassified Kitasatospora TaxID=2633591 RepID=UPI002F907310|nr:DUF5132 domain-containing protein [Kitasatospora sp. NBC_01300]
MPPVVPPFLIGLVVAPLAKRLLKPLVRGVVKTSVGIVMEVRKAAHEAGENIHDLAAEVAADVVAAQGTSGDGRRAAENAAPVEKKTEVTDAGEAEARTPKIRATVGAGKAN